MNEDMNNKESQNKESEKSYYDGLHNSKQPWSQTTNTSSNSVENLR